MNQLPADFKTPLGMFYQWESAQPDKVWLQQCSTDGDTTYTYAEAGKIARELAAGMLARGLEIDDKVGIYSTNTARWLLVDLALMMAGLVSVPIYATMPEDKIQYIADHSEMKMMFVGDQCNLSPEQVENHFKNQFIVVGNGANTNWDDMFGEEPLEGNPDWDNDKLWTITYTSGTTGTPKGVMHSLSSIPYSGCSLAKVTGVNTDTRFFSYLPLAHIAERCVVEMHCIYCGGMIGFNQNLETFMDDLRRIKPHYFNSVPRIWANLKAGIVAQMGEEKWKAVQSNPELGKQVGAQVLESMGLGDCFWAQSGSAPIAPSLIQEWNNLGLPIVEGYGQSESMNGLFNAPDNYKIGTVGRSFDPSESMVSEEGELLLRSPGNMVGYYKDPQKTKETIVDGWIHTGDRVVMDEDGFVTITGRVKEIFKTAKGKYIAPAPIEGKFARLVGVAQTCLVGRGMPQPIMLMVEDEAVKPSAKDIEKQLESVNADLEAHEKISHIVVCHEGWTVENGLLTHTMKMLRDDIENRYMPLIEDRVMSSDEKVVYESEGVVA